MWGSIGALVAKAGEALGIEIPGMPDLGAASDVVTEAVATVSDQAGTVATGATEALTEATGGLGEVGTGLGETVTGVGDQAAAAATTITERLPG